MPAKYLGTLLTEKGLLTAPQVQQVLARQMQTGMRFGETAVALFKLRMTDIWRVLAIQQADNLPRVDLVTEHHDGNVLGVLPARFAWAARILPLRFEDWLICATTEKALPDAAAALAERLDMPARFVIADELQLKEFIMRRYPM